MLFPFHSLPPLCLSLFFSNLLRLFVRMRSDSIGWLVGCYFSPPPSLQASSRIYSLTACGIYDALFYFSFAKAVAVPPTVGISTRRERGRCMGGVLNYSACCVVPSMPSMRLIPFMRAMLFPSVFRICYIVFCAFLFSLPYFFFFFQLASAVRTYA